MNTGLATNTLRHILKKGENMYKKGMRISWGYMPGQPHPIYSGNSSKVFTGKIERVDNDDNELYVSVDGEGSHCDIIPFNRVISIVEGR